MRGRAGGKTLSSDSLLQSTPTFELASKSKPIINQEHTFIIENMIKLHVLGEYLGDIIPRALPEVGLGMGEGKIPEVSQEKSKLDLGKLYEQEYLKKFMRLDVEDEESYTSEDKIRYNLRGPFAELCSKLDAL